MAKFKIVIHRKQKRSDGTVNIKIRVTHRRKVRDIATDYNVLPKYFDKKTGLVKYGGAKTNDDVDKINSKLLIQIGVMADKAEKQRNVEFMDISSLVRILRDKHREMDFFAVIDSLIAEKKKDGSLNYAGSFITTKSLVEKFTGTSVLYFETIDYTWLTRLERSWTDRGMSRTSAGIFIRNIRNVWNEGYKRGHVEMNHYPFKKYKIPKGEPRKNMVLTPEEMATIGKIEIKEPLMRWSRDMAMLSFLLIGMNPKDIFEAAEISAGRISYRRSKGKREYSIKVPPQALHIIKRYPGKKYLLDTMDKYSDYRAATKRIDYKLKDIARISKIEKSLTLYTFRHSWSAYARYLGISKDDIAASLGHKSIDLPQVTEFYTDIKEEQRRVDDANKKVVRLILRTPPKKITE